MTTRGIQFLRENDVEYELLTYRYERMGARIAADALGLPHRIVLKSLVFRADDGSFAFALIDAAGTVSARKLGRVTSRKHVEPASPRDAQRVTGYLVGGISPLGSRRRLPVVLDARAAQEDLLVINAGARGKLVRLRTKDLVALLDAQVADIRAG